MFTDVSDVQEKLRKWTYELEKVTSLRTVTYKHITPVFREGLVRGVPKYTAEVLGADLWFTKWKGLKDNFVKFKKSSEPAHADTYKNYKNWPWAENLMFLDDCLSSRRIPRYRPKPRVATPDAEPTTSTADVYAPDEITTNSDSSADQTNEQETQQEQEVQESSGEEQKTHTIKKIKSTSLDGVEHFFLSYAQSFKKLPRRMQIMLKLEIATLFSRYELQADGVTADSVDAIPRIVPHPVVNEFDFNNAFL